MSLSNYMIVGGIVIIGIGFGYVVLGISMMGLPRKCSKHGWSTGSVCLECIKEE